jgi:hypothetical protein
MHVRPMLPKKQYSAILNDRPCNYFQIINDFVLNRIHWRRNIATIIPFYKYRRQNRLWSKRIFSSARGRRISFHSGRHDDTFLCHIPKHTWVACCMVLFSDIRNYNRHNIPQNNAIFQLERILPIF